MCFGAHSESMHLRASRHFLFKKKKKKEHSKKTFTKMQMAESILMQPPQAVSMPDHAFQ